MHTLYQQTFQAGEKRISVNASVSQYQFDESGSYDLVARLLSDIFEEGGQQPGEFHGGLGMMTFHGIPKPVYRAYELLHRMRGERIHATGEQGSVGIVRAIVYNHDGYKKPPAVEEVCDV